MKNDTSIRQFLLSENNRLTYVYKTGRTDTITEVVCVSLEIRHLSEWVTIIYFDSSHGGILHRHTYNSLDQYTDVVDAQNVRKKGSQRQLLRWAIDDIKKNYTGYKKKFISRSKRSNSRLEIDFY